MKGLFSVLRLRASVWLLMACLAGPGGATAADAGAARQLLAEGEALLERNEAQAAFFVLEHAAFLAPDDTAVRTALARALARMGAYDTARHLQPAADFAAQPLQRLELAWGYSSNRSQSPALDTLTLTLPGVAPAPYTLAEPYHPQPGPQLWLGYGVEHPAGHALQARLAAAPDRSLGQVALFGHYAWPGAPGWALRGEYQHRLGDGSQLGILLRRDLALAPAWLAELDFGWRIDSDDNASRQHYREYRGSLVRRDVTGDYRLALQTSDPVGAAPGGRQNRTLLGWSRGFALAASQLHAALAVRFSRDADTYHPWIANGERRWQRTWLLQTGWEKPLDAGRALFIQANLERHDSNIALYRYQRNELWIGVVQQW